MQPACIAVAYSGGRDSTALLHATLAAVRESGLVVVALHVHHGLQADADEWLEHCAETCRRWARRGAPLSLHVRRLVTTPAPGDSIEAWARRERYRALREMALSQGATAVLLAHHQRDQAETLLLQALRGAGVSGLSAMPRSVERDGVTWLRPWLEVSRASIDAYVRRHRLRHIHDGSNDDPRFARSRLRAHVWPALSAAFPQAEGSLAMAAGWSQQAAAVLAEVALEDLERVADDQGLHLAGWAALTPARGSNVLRAWIAGVTGRPAPASLMQRLATELMQPAASAWPAAAGELRRHRGRLTYVAASPVVSSAAVVEEVLAITRAGRYRLPGWRGVLRVTRVASEGVALSRLGSLRVAARSGGEQFQLGPGRPPRALKKQYQARAIAAWERDGPLLFAGDTLIFAAGLGLDARAWAAPGEPQVGLLWLPA